MILQMKYTTIIIILYVVTITSIIINMTYAEKDKHIFGSKTIAYCPVTNMKLHIDEVNTNVVVQLQYGQKIYVADQAAANKIRMEPRKYFMNPLFDKPLEGKDGYRGLPDMHNETVHCPITNTSFMVKQMASPRIMMRHGQFLYFCCMDCMMDFLIKPGKYILNAGPNANDFRNENDYVNNNNNPNEMVQDNGKNKNNDNGTENDLEGKNPITVIVITTIFLSICVELIVFAGYVFIYKKRRNVVKFFSLSNIEDSDDPEDEDDIDVVVNDKRMVKNVNVVERYTDA